jgi:hypothetical protein
MSVASLADKIWNAYRYGKCTRAEAIDEMRAILSLTEAGAADFVGDKRAPSVRLAEAFASSGTMRHE